MCVLLLFEDGKNGFCDVEGCWPSLEQWFSLSAASGPNVINQEKMYFSTYNLLILQFELDIVYKINSRF